MGSFKGARIEKGVQADALTYLRYPHTCGQWRAQAVARYGGSVQFGI